MAYVMARTLHEALGAMAAGPATIVAGATDVYPAHGEGRLSGRVIDISQAVDLRAITVTDQTVRIGAGTTWTDLIKRDLPCAFDGLKAAAREVGAVQVQNRATLCGNLCTASPAGDGIPCLMALDASVELASATRTRTLPLSKFITGVRKTALEEGELLSAILVPTPAVLARSAFMKLGTRHSLVISIAMVSAVITPDPEGRIAAAAISVGACSPVATRLTALERELVGAAPHEASQVVRKDHLLPLAPISDVRGSAAYRMEAAEELVRRTLNGCCEPERIAA